jgi:hypothetical protein
MDREQKQDWSWLPRQMPRVSALIKTKRAELGDAHVNLCWRRGVVERQAGWFFAREGALAVGAPFDDPEMANFAAMHVTSTQGLLLLRTPEAADGA